MKKIRRNHCSGRIRRNRISGPAGTLSLMILFVLIASTAWAQETLQLNRSLSKKYVQLAFSEKLARSTAEQYIDTALVFWPSNPDALFVKAQALEREQEYTRALDLMPGVFNGNALSFLERNEALEFYLSLLLRTGRSDEVLMLMSILPREITLSQKFLVFQCQALKREGQTELLIERLDTGIKLYPGDDTIGSLLVQYSPGYGRNVRNRLLTYGDQENYGRNTLRALIETTTNFPQKQRILDIYVNRFGDDLFSKVHSLGETENPKADDYAAILNEEEYIPESIIKSLRELARDTNSENAYMEAFSDFTGFIQRDPDNDDIFEVFEYYGKGEISEVRANIDGDPRDEVIIAFSDRIPVRFTLEMKDGSEVKGEYGRYPNIESFSIPSGKERVLQIKMVPFAVRVPLAGFDRFRASDEVPLIRAEDLPDLDIMLTQAASIDTVQKSEVISRFDRTRNRIEISRGDRITMIGEFMNGTIEERKKDPDADGFFEVREYYMEGNLVRITYDGNENSIPEYVEDFGDKLVRKWDMDEDGIAEYRLEEELN